MPSLILTCKKQGAPLDEAFIAPAGGADPANTFKAGQAAPNRRGVPKKPAPVARSPLTG